MAIGILLTALLVIGLGGGEGDTIWRNLLMGMFTAVSMLTTTGFITGEEAAFPLSPALLIMPIILLGGCTGSTAGGLKQMRLRILTMHGGRELARLTHPHGVVRKALGARPVSDDVMAAVWALFIVLILGLCVATLLLAATGVDLHAAVAAAIAALSNTGPALTLITSEISGYAAISDPGLWVLSFTMILGRLEMLPLLILLSPLFWRG